MCNSNETWNKLKLNCNKLRTLSRRIKRNLNWISSKPNSKKIKSSESWSLRNENSKFSWLSLNWRMMSWWKRTINTRNTSTRWHQGWMLSETRTEVSNAKLTNRIQLSTIKRTSILIWSLTAGTRQEDLIWPSQASNSTAKENHSNDF